MIEVVPLTLREANEFVANFIDTTSRHKAVVLRSALSLMATWSEWQSSVGQFHKVCKMASRQRSLALCPG